MDPNIKKTIDDTTASLIDLVKNRTGDFLDQNQDAKLLVEDRMRRLAEIGTELAKAELAGDKDGVDRALNSYEVVRDTIELMAGGVAVNASAASRESFKAALAIVIDYGKQLLPVLIKLAVGAIKK